MPKKYDLQYNSSNNQQVFDGKNWQTGCQKKGCIAQSASFNYEGKTAIYCSKHKQKNRLFYRQKYSLFSNRM